MMTVIRLGVGEMEEADVITASAKNLWFLRKIIVLTALKVGSNAICVTDR